MSHPEVFTSNLQCVALLLIDALLKCVVRKVASVSTITTTIVFYSSTRSSEYLNEYLSTRGSPRCGRPWQQQQWRRPEIHRMCQCRMSACLLLVALLLFLAPKRMQYEYYFHFCLVCSPQRLVLSICGIIDTSVTPYVYILWECLHLHWTVPNAVHVSILLAKDMTKVTLDVRPPGVSTVGLLQRKWYFQSLRTDCFSFPGLLSVRDTWLTSLLRGAWFLLKPKLETGCRMPGWLIWWSTWHHSCKVLTNSVSTVHLVSTLVIHTNHNPILTALE